MPIDPSIALGIKPIEIESPINAMTRVLQMQQARQQMQQGEQNNQLSQMKMDEYSRSKDRGNRLIQLMQGLPGTSTDEQRSQALKSAGYFDEADKLDTGSLNRRKTESEAGAKDADTQNKVIGVYRDVVGSVTDPATAAEYVKAMHSDPRLANTPMARVPLEIALQQIGKDPASFEQWKKNFALGAAKFVEMNKPTLTTQNLGGTSQITATPGLGGAPTVLSNSRITQSEDNAANNATQIRGQNLIDSRSKDANNIALNTPEYKQDGDGNFIALPKKVAPGATIVGQPVVDANGKQVGGAPKPLTESQGKATTFAARMQNAESVINQMEGKGVSGSDVRTIAAGSPYTNFMATADGQKYRQAQEDWVTANLRQESGAAIGVDEMAKDVRKFFPVPGDSQEVKQQKQQARSVAAQGMGVQAGPGLKSVPGILNKAHPSSGNIDALLDKYK